LFGIVDCYWFN